MFNRLRPRLTFANVVSCLALFVALGGSAYAVRQLPKNSVGTPQLKRGAVANQKVRKNAINGSKVKNNSLTGADINLSKLGTVPTAQSAAGAGMANTANAAGSANTANVADSLAPSEGWHEVGMPDEPQFQGGWENVPGQYETAGFFKDHEGVVHLKGDVTGGGNFVFTLPPGYRPATGRAIAVPVVCTGGSCPDTVGQATIYGPGSGLNPSYDGGVSVQGEFVFLEGITFRAES